MVAALQLPSAVIAYLPQIEEVCDNTAGGVVDPKGVPLPPCIVMGKLKGESLYDWSRRAEPDHFTSLAVRPPLSRRDACH